jgi:hypothetical protein
LSVLTDGDGEGIMKGRDLILLIILYVGIGLLLFWYCKPAHPSVPDGAVPVVAYLDSDVKVYSFTQSGDKCYVAVGRLHGYTVDIECEFHRDTIEIECTQEWEECE